MGLRILVDIDVLLKLLQRVLRTMCERIQTRVHVMGRDVPVGEHVVRRQGIVSRETVKWIGKHLETLVEVDSKWRKVNKASSRTLAEYLSVEK